MELQSSVIGLTMVSNTTDKISIRLRLKKEWIFRRVLSLLFLPSEGTRLFKRKKILPQQSNLHEKKGGGMPPFPGNGCPLRRNRQPPNDSEDAAKIRANRPKGKQALYAFIACLKSSIISFTSSMPTERRIRSGATPASSNCSSLS